MTTRDAIEATYRHARWNTGFHAGRWEDQRQRHEHQLTIENRTIAETLETIIDTLDGATALDILAAGDEEEERGRARGLTYAQRMADSIIEQEAA